MTTKIDTKIDTKFTIPVGQLTNEQSELIFERLRDIAKKHKEGVTLTDKEQELMKLTTFKTDSFQ